MLVAINRNCIDKPNNDADFGKINHGFDNVDISLRGLADAVQLGFAFCPQHTGKNRKSANFQVSSVIAVDVDHGLRLETALEDDFINQYGGFIYTTVNHTPEQHRFRIVFELEEPISDRDQMKHALTGLIARLGGDRACTDACRMFYGNTQAQITYIDKRLPASEVQKLALRGDETGWTRGTAKSDANVKVTVHSRVTLSNEELVRTATGKTCRLVDLDVLTPIHCPMHVDDHPSAFTLRSRKGTPGLHCKACGATFYVTAEGPYYDFDYDLRVVRNKSLEEWEEQNSNNPLLGFDEDSRSGVHFICEEFLRPVETNASVVLIRSPKGTGKTELLRQVVEDAKAKKQSILLIGHRQSLIMATANRLGLIPYIIFGNDAEDKNSTTTEIAPQQNYAVCLDSMPTRLEPQEHRYDIVIIDEVEQVLAHLTGSTLRRNRQQAILWLRFYLGRAAKIYALDADLNRVSVMSLSSLIEDGTKSVLLVVNDWAPKRGTTHLYASEHHIVDVFRQALDDGKRCFFCANAKDLIEKLALSLQEQYGDGKAFRWITSGNSQTAETQEFLKGLPDSLLSYDALLVSPAVGTGVDITFTGGEQKVDVVFGLFKPHVTTHFDMDQQLSRVRHPGQVHVWVTPRRFSFETNPVALRRELENASREERHIVALDDDGTPKYSLTDSVYMDIYSEVRSLQRASKNNLRENFCQLRKQNGWDIVEVTPSVEEIDLGKAILKRGKQLQEEIRGREMCAARVLLEHEYAALSRKGEHGTLQEPDIFALRRYEIERFYLLPVSQELVDLDDNGTYRHAVRLFESILDPDKADYDWMLKNRISADIKEGPQRRKLLVTLFTAAGLYDDATGFDRRATVIHDGLTAFADLCERNKISIERLLNMSLRADCRPKPVSQLLVFLKLVGLKLEKTNTRKQGDQKIYTYRIDDAKLTLMESITAHRADPAVRQEWDLVRSGDAGTRQIIDGLQKLREGKKSGTKTNRAGST